MKKRNLLLALLSSSLILASCGGDDKPADESAKETEASQSDDSNAASGEPGLTSEPEISVDTRTNEQKVKDLFALMAEGKSSTIEYNGYITEFYGENKGMWNEVPASDTDSESSGIAVVPNYGIYSVAFDSDSQEYYFTSILTPNTQLDLGDVQYTTTDLGKAAKTVTFTESFRTHTFSTDDATFCSTMLAVLGGASAANIYATKKVSFNINEDGSALTNMTLELKGSTDTKNYPNQTMEGLKISKIGSTFDLDFELLITNPGISAKTGWSQYETAYFTTRIHQQFTLPFPTGASYAVNVSATEDGQFMFEDLVCGNLVNSYKNQLAAAGFAQNDDKTNLTKGIYCYEKTLVAATTSAGPVMEYVFFTWQNDPSTAVYYPNGKFRINAYAKQEPLKITTAQLATQLASLTLTDGTQYIPVLPYGNCTGASVEDMTEDAYDYFYYYYGYDVDFYGFINLYYPTEAEAVTAANNINTQFAKAGYTYNTSNEDYRMVVASDPYSYETETVVAVATVAYDDNGNYLGYVELFICHYVEEDWYY